MWNDRFKDLCSFEDLTGLIDADKHANGMGAVTQNRYPLRFVLFDNFRDSYRFIEYMQQEKAVAVQSVDKWLNSDYPDLMLTYQELADDIADFVRSLQGRDCIITPFSELARFYDNQSYRTFDALISTLKAIEASKEACQRAQRVYIPIVGLEGKMSTFENDTQINVWHLHHAEDDDETYRMVLVDDPACFGVKNVGCRYVVVDTVAEWLDVWKDTERHDRKDIVCTSKAIHANAAYAQPDNAFNYVTPHNVFEFLQDGLRLDLGELAYKEAEEEYWALLAEQIDLSRKFSLAAFVADYFGVNEVGDYRAFLRIWFSHGGAFDRWLLCAYYAMGHKDDEFLVKCIAAMGGYSNRDLFQEIALYMTTIEPQIEERRHCLNAAADQHVTLTETVEVTMGKRLEAIAKQGGHHAAIKYFTRITSKEKELAIVWLGNGLVAPHEVRAFYPDLFDYVRKQPLLSAPAWMADYIDCYKKAKLANEYTEDIRHYVAQYNGDSVKFDTWYQSLKTTRTLLTGRTDIEVYYWLDGLGVEWIPFIQGILKAHGQDNVYLNDVMVARALLPTTTAVNKVELQRLSEADIQDYKIGDLDAHAHQSTLAYPKTVIEEMEIVRKAIEHIINIYAGKKIAIVSDHGLTYLSQKQDGLNLAGFEPGHHGRVATIKQGAATTDTNYIILEDGKTTCALTHRSLCNKVPRDQGIHGGCTPEEVLVPVFIISSTPNECAWTATLLTPDVMATQPRVRFRIKGLASTDSPTLKYGGTYYGLNKVDTEEYESDDLPPNEAAREVSVVVGSVARTFHVNWQMGAKEDDLFDF